MIVKTNSNAIILLIEVELLGTLFPNLMIDPQTKRLYSLSRKGFGENHIEYEFVLKSFSKPRGEKS